MIMMTTGGNGSTEQFKKSYSAFVRLDFLDDATIRKRVQLGIRMMYQQTCTQTRRASVDGWTELDLWQVQQHVSVIR